MKNIIFILACFVLIASCDEIPVPMKDPRVPPGNKTVLVEDFTGIQCTNCPKGARQIESTRTTPDLKKRIIPLAIHSLGFHEQFPNSKYEFRTPRGQAMEEYLGVVLGKPSAAINRTVNPAKSNLFYGKTNVWPSLILNELARPTEVNMTIALAYNSNSRELNIDLTYIPVEDIAFPLTMTAVIAESGLVDPQVDVNGVVEDYVHNHVLREVISAIQGDPLGNSFEKGEIYTKSFGFTIPPEDGWWVAENCEIIAFVSDADSKRVLQAISHEVIEE